eukprot:CAMPEP_0183791970 /NCGR_PEP_ID=MMETSP0803_2-20130417/2237_1 /TAXON_ID=195967 /ORGANISM="Crustomastix stigmata, Strain CCMP3273" /LENGTH=282 /DNA_ID=CAMNT_0026036309 /DNA_START=35 /DNA_END=883 /DNA_ORIENTATION=-
MAAVARGAMAVRRPRVAARRSAVKVQAAASTVVAQPPRVVVDPLPKVYVYDHCPFCVRVRLALGLKNIKHEVVFMANDDKDTPTKLLGKKIAPILERTDKDMIMGESLDIIAYFDESEEFGATGAFAAASGRDDIKAWMKSVKDLLRLLHRPRYMMAALPEFQQKDSRDYFVMGHPVPPFDKPEWKDEAFGQEKRWEEFNKAFEMTPELLPQLNEALAKLEGLIYSEDYCTEGGLSYDDIDLWARLRSITLVKGAEFGPKTKAYLENLSERGDIPLYFGMAC